MVNLQGLIWQEADALHAAAHTCHEWQESQTNRVPENNVVAIAGSKIVDEGIAWQCVLPLHHKVEVLQPNFQNGQHWQSKLLQKLSVSEQQHAQRH